MLRSDPRRDALAPSRDRDSASSSPRVAHTLTACTRCRQRKTRCDPGLPRCGPCERTNGLCEYWDPAKKCNVRRDYVVWLQHRAQDLQMEIARLQGADNTEDPEPMIRNAAAVRLQDADETKFLGPSSGTQITRLVMQLAKHFTDSKSIKDIVPDARARQVQELYAVEAAKPTSKIYPLISSVAAEHLPNSDLIALLYQLYCLKVQPMYPVLHEPTLAADMQAAQAGTADDFQNFITRMVIAVSLQKLDAQYAGLADSYYLAALRYMEAVVRRMDLGTLQAFALIAEYSLLTPTRTAIYFICGLAVRLLQELGIHEEASITRGADGLPIDALTVDMRRRVFWCIWTMEAGLSHALGRPMSLATGRDHLDVQSFAMCDDQYITQDGIEPGARPVLKKWIAMHFFKMRLIQLEVRRKLYQKKRATPKDDQDPWFQDIMTRLDEWRDASPDGDEGAGLNKVWFVGRYNTIIAMLYRPCPQIPCPSTSAAMKCFDAAKYNIYMVQQQVKSGTVSMTWIFTQALFMAINTMLWSLSYAEIRAANPRVEVEQHLVVGMESVVAASDRWPGVASAHALYVHIIEAILKIYDKEGDLTLNLSTPSNEASPSSSIPSGQQRSRTTSPGVLRNSAQPSVNVAPFGYFRHQAGSDLDQSFPFVEQSSPGIISSPQPSPSSGQPTPLSVQYQASSANVSRDKATTRPVHRFDGPPRQKHQHTVPMRADRTHDQPVPSHPQLPTEIDFSSLNDGHWGQQSSSMHQSFAPAHDPYQQRSFQYEELQPQYAQTNTAGYDMFQSMQSQQTQYFQQSLVDAHFQYDHHQVLDPTYWQESVGQPQAWEANTNGSAANGTFGLSVAQQHELMHSLETNGLGDIETMIAGANMIFNPQIMKQRQSG